jgi:acetoacetyl-CoA synthetase
MPRVARSPDGADRPVAEGELLWEPSPERSSGSRVAHYIGWLRESRGLDFESYTALWQWSVTEVGAFWESLVGYFDVKLGGRYDRVLMRPAAGEIAGARWFEGAELNYVGSALGHPDEDEAIVAVDELGSIERIEYGELRELVASAAAGLQELGVGRGDRVAAVLPNNAAAVIAFLATASLGAVWSSCAPEFGAPSMVDRFRQIDPKVLVAADGYRYNGRDYDLAGKIGDLREALPSLAATVLVPCRPGEGFGELAGGTSDQLVHWGELFAAGPAVAPVPVPFEHPLWILYSSGTTGLPKPIVHGHGGIVLEHLKAVGLHFGLRPADRFFWYTTTGWMMWNMLLGGLLVGSSIVCYDGSPAWPDQSRLWSLAADAGITCFGTSAPFLEACRKSGLSPRAELDLSCVHTLGSTGAPLSPDGFAWATSEIGDDVLVGSVSGGTDVCTAFVGSCELLPVRAGELQARALGAAVAAFDPSGEPVVGEVGELVITEPMPTMPLFLWGDADGSRLRASYYDAFPGAWRHGDWVKITEEGSCVVYGRSDATLNRGGVRMGTAEFYRVVESLAEVADSLVVDTSALGEDGQLILFVVPAGDAGDAGELRDQLRRVIRQQLSPRHVPDRIVLVRAIPRTLNGKKVEVPIRRILLGTPAGAAVSEDALANPDALSDLLAAAAEQ